MIDIPQLPPIAEGACSPILEIPPLEIPDIQPPDLTLPPMPGFELPDIPNITITQICAPPFPDVTFPTMADLTGICTSIFSIPSQYIPWGELQMLLPSLPTVKIPLWDNRPDKYITSKEFMEYLTALPSSMIPAVINFLFDFIKKFTAGIVDPFALIPDPLPIPGLPGISFAMLLPPYDPQPFYDALAAVIGVDLSLYNPLVVPPLYKPPFLPTFDEIMSMIPEPLISILPPYALEFGSMTDYFKSAVQYVFDYCSNLVINILLDVVKLVTDWLKILEYSIPGIPSGTQAMIDEWIPPPPIPDILDMIPIPSLQALIAKIDIDALLKENYPEIYKLKETLPEEYAKAKALLIAEFTAGYAKIMETKLPTVEDLLAMVKDILPPLACIFKLPQPLLPDIGQGAEDIKIALQAFMADANTLVFRLITEYIEMLPLIGPAITAVLPTLSDFFVMPALCFPVPTVNGIIIPPIPTIPDLKIPSIAEFKVPDLTMPELKPLTLPDIPPLDIAGITGQLESLGYEMPTVQELALNALFPGATPALMALDALGIDPVQLATDVATEQGVELPEISDLPGFKLPSFKLPSFNIPDIVMLVKSKFNSPDLGIPELKTPEIELPPLDIAGITGQLDTLGYEMPTVQELALNALFPGATPALMALDALGIDPVALGTQLATEQGLEIPNFDFKWPELPAIPSIADLSIPNVELPNLEPPEIKIPELPSVG